MAERAQALYAYDTAIQHLQTALDLMQAGEQNELWLAVLEALADARRLRGKHAKAIEIYQEALEVWHSIVSAGPSARLKMPIPSRSGTKRRHSRRASGSSRTFRGIRGRFPGFG